MKLAEIIIDNERKKQAQKNRQLVLARVKSLVYTYPKEVLQVCHRTGVSVSTLLPAPVLYGVVVKHVQRNSELRDAIAKMLIEMDGYASADGSILSVVASSLTAVGSVLAGIGRSQSETDKADVQAIQNDYEQKMEMQKEQSRRQTMWTIGLCVIAVVGIIIAFSVFGKPKAPAQLKPQFQPA